MSDPTINAILAEAECGELDSLPILADYLDERMDGRAEVVRTVALRLAGIGDGGRCAWHDQCDCDRNNLLDELLCLFAFDYQPPQMMPHEPVKAIWRNNRRVYRRARKWEQPDGWIAESTTKQSPSGRPYTEIRLNLREEFQHDPS